MMYLANILNSIYAVSASHITMWSTHWSIKTRVDRKKPRLEGLTYIIDKLEGLDKENFEIISPLIDLVNIYGALPLLIPDIILKKKFNFTMIRIYLFPREAQ